MHARPIRLARGNYVGRRAYFVTVCCHDKERWLAELDRGEWVLGLLLNFAARHSFALVAFCAMPDHLHFLALAE